MQHVDETPVLRHPVPVQPVDVYDPHLGVRGAARQAEEGAAGLVGQVGSAPPGLVLALREAGAVPHKRLSCGREVVHSQYSTFILVTPFVKAPKFAQFRSLMLR